METNREIFLERINAIAQELSLPLEDDHVLEAYFKRYDGVSNEIADEFFPIWLKNVCYGLKHNGSEILEIMRTPNGVWEPYQSK